MKNRSNRMDRGLAQILDQHFVICAAAIATAVAASANAAVVYRTANLAVPVTLTGLYMNVETGGYSPATPPSGWDVNPFGTSSTTVSLIAATGTGYMRNPSAGFATGATRIDLGTVIGSPSYFYGNSIAAIGSGAGQWAANSTGYFGFNFLAADALTHYGWMRLSIGANAGTRTIVDYAFESTAGASIAAGTGSIPAPGALGLLALAGMAKRRRRA